MRLPSVSLLAAAAFLLTSSSSADDKKKDPDQIGNRNVGSGINFYSIEKEIALGKQLAEEVRRQSKLLDDPSVGEYINRLGQNLVRNSDATVPFTFNLPMTRPIRLQDSPGGKIDLLGPPW